MTESNTLQDKSMRAKAFLIHLGISLILLISALAVIFLTWYPGQFILVGGLEGLALLSGVTLVLGPVLTLVIFNPGKKTVLIKLDLVIIGVTQAVCIAFGLWIIYQERPILQVVADDGIYVVSASELRAHSMDIKQLNLPDRTPHNVVLDIPLTTKAELDQLKLVHQLISRKPLHLVQKLYLPTASYNGDFQARVDYIRSQVPASVSQRLTALTDREDCTWLPLRSVHRTGYGCYSQEKGLISIAKN